MLKALKRIFGGADSAEFDDIVSDIKTLFDRLGALVARKQQLADEKTAEAQVAMNEAATAREAAVQALTAQGKFAELIGEPVPV